MYKVCVCGHFGKKKNLLNGQTIKTKLLTDELKVALGPQNVKIIDTHQWNRHPFILLINCILLAKACKNIVILPAHNGIRVFAPLFLFIKKVFNTKLHYVVIGGWLPELLEKYPTLKTRLMKFDGIYVETNAMVRALQNKGFTNIRLFPNFKKLKILKESEMVYTTQKPFKLCTFSRVLKEKGIEDAIEVIERINNNFGKTVFTLDIYGPIDETYKERFEKLKTSFSSYIEYKGEVNFNHSIKVLKDYYALLFPTHYYTEGVPGTIIDAYAAGVPVISSKWENFDDVVDDMNTGIGYEFNNRDELQHILMKIVNSEIDVNKMKVTCLLKAQQYTSNNVIEYFVKYL